MTFWGGAGGPAGGLVGTLAGRDWSSAELWTRFLQHPHHKTMAVKMTIRMAPAIASKHTAAENIVIFD